MENIQPERKIGYQVFRINIQLHKNLPDFFKIKRKNIQFQINLSDHHKIMIKLKLRFTNQINLLKFKFFVYIVNSKFLKLGQNQNLINLHHLILSSITNLKFHYLNYSANSF